MDADSLHTLAIRSNELQSASLELLARVARTQTVARSARIASLTLRGNVLPTRADPKDVLVAALDAALNATQATFGNVQLLDRRRILRIRAQRGFAAPFLEFFDEVRPGLESACGAALMIGRQVVVRDVRGHPLFRGKAGEVLAEARVAAVVSSPIFDPQGTLLGILSVHHTVPGARSVAELMKLRRIARGAGLILGKRAAA